MAQRRSVQMQKVVEFRRYLKRKGKKDHVVDDLVERCKVFEEFLNRRRKPGLDDADEEDLRAFLDAMKDRKTGINNHLRALGLYYGFTSRRELSALLNHLREQRISLTKKPFELKNFRGVSEKYITLLEKEGIANVDQMLEKGKTSAGRRRLAAKTGMPAEAILEFVKLADLSRIEGLKNIRARLYYDAGVDTVEKIAEWTPEKLQACLVEYVKKTCFNGIAPLPEEVRNTIETAKRLPKIVKY